AGARKRARQHGYQLEEFLLGSKNMTSERMRNILLARGITGVLVAPQPRGVTDGKIAMDWSPFAALTFGYSLTWPALHLVTSHHGNAARLAVQKLAALGYRRIGLHVDRISNARAAGGWVGGYAGEVWRNRDLAWFEPFPHDTNDIDQFLRWARAQRLDAVITWSEFIDRVRESGRIRVPEDLGMVSLRVRPENEHHTGINQNEHEIGAVAVDTLVGLLGTNVRGIPDNRRCILIDGVWNEGATTRVIAKTR
ncbi:MAG: hypothetical protein ABII82_14390, partial [Verrucomicrobiota bacterium]